MGRPTIDSAERAADLLYKALKNTMDETRDGQHMTGRRRVVNEQVLEAALAYFRYGREGDEQADY